MKTEQINLRLDANLVSALERVAREEALDRATAIRRLLESSIKEWELEHALVRYRRGEVSIGRAAEEAGLTQWELIDAARAAGMSYPLDAQEVAERLEELEGRGGGARPATLPDIPPKPGGVLLVGINPAPVSVAAGHYYQGRLGRRLWRRLERIGLLTDAKPGAEDDAFARAGHGLSDLVKRPTASAVELSEDELAAGAEDVRMKVREWKPGLILFAFSQPARRLLGTGVKPGPIGELDGVPAFLLTGPYAPTRDAERVDAELRALLKVDATAAGDHELSQPISESDLESGRIRLKQPSRRFFPVGSDRVEIVLRGERVAATYNARLRERKSPVLGIGRERLARLVRRNEQLRVSRGLGGVVQLD